MAAAFFALDFGARINELSFRQQERRGVGLRIPGVKA